jgi:hypothetical protein
MLQCALSPHMKELRIKSAIFRGKTKSGSQLQQVRRVF